MPDTQVNVSGVEKDVAGAEVNVSGVWKTCHQIWANVAGTWKEVLNLVTLSAGSITGFEITPTDSYAGIRFNADGTVDQNIDQTYSSRSGSTDWIIPNGFASGDYDVRYTAHTGTAFTTAAAAEDTWIALSAAREWTLIRSGLGISSCTATFQIRDPAGTTVASQVISFLAEVDSGA
jgi:hypothetical protein